MKALFKVLAKVNKAVLPKSYTRDLNRLSKFDKALVGWKYWVLLRSLD